jgi:hypothetical protein
VRISDPNRPASETNDVSWNELAPTSPAPQPGAIADFRDYQGCAGYEQTGVELCFTLGGDVSSVDLKAEKIEVKGLSQVIQQHLDAQSSSECPSQVTAVEFVKATKIDNSNITVQYSVQRSAPQGCDPSPVSVELALKQI